MHSLDDEMEGQKKPKEQREFILSPGINIQGTGLNDIGLYTTEDNAYYILSHRLDQEVSTFTARSLLLEFIVKFDLGILDCTQAKIQLIDGHFDNYCPDQLVGLSFGIDMCRGYYRFNADLKIGDEEVKRLNRSVNIVDLPGSSSDFRMASRHLLSFEIFDNDTYAIRIDNDNVYDEPQSLLDDFNIVAKEFIEFSFLEEEPIEVPSNIIKSLKNGFKFHQDAGIITILQQKLAYEKRY